MTNKEGIIAIIIVIAMIITIMFMIGIVLNSLEEYYPVNIWCKTICKISITIVLSYLGGYLGGIILNR